MIWVILTLSVTLDDGWIGAVWWLDRNEGLGEMVEGTNERKKFLTHSTPQGTQTS